MTKNFSESREKELKYWSQFAIALSQVTFAAFWAALFIPLDPYRVSLVILNGLATVALGIGGWLLSRK